MNTHETSPTNADTDGDGIEDGRDDAPTKPEDFDGFQDGDGKPETGPKVGRPVQLPNAEQITLNYELLARTLASEDAVSVVVVTQNVNLTLYSAEGDGVEKRSGSVDLSRFAGETVRIVIRREYGGSVRLSAFRLVIDTDGDGLSDRVEQNGLRIGNGERLYTNPYEADTDGDGLTDGEEVERRHDPNSCRLGTQDTRRDGGGGAVGPYFKLHSDPTEVDTDGGELIHGVHRPHIFPDARACPRT